MTKRNYIFILCKYFTLLNVPGLVYTLGKSHTVYSVCVIIRVAHHVEQYSFYAVETFKNIVSFSNLHQYRKKR